MKKIIIAVTVLCVVFGFSALGFTASQGASLDRNVYPVNDRTPKASVISDGAQTLPSLESTSKDTGILPAYSTPKTDTGKLPLYKTTPPGEKELTSNTFADINAGLTGVDGGSAAWGDYDNDGYLDILLIGQNDIYPSYPSPIARIYHNNGNGTFTNINAGLANLLGSRAAWGDYDNDGYLDILLTGYAFGLTSPYRASIIYHNNGNGTFTNINAELIGVTDSSIAWGDYDNDGRLDILLTGTNTMANNSISIIYHNQGGIANTVPNGPSSLSSVVSGNSVTLTWQETTDAQTPQDGLNYNIYIGTTGLVDTLSPMAQLNNGWRKIPAIGPIQGITKTIYNLPDGYYYWGVQAIDTALAGSLFSKVNAFTIGNAAYTISGRITDSGTGVPDVQIKEGSQVLTTTDSSGNYIFTKSSGWSGMIKPVKSNYIFSPIQRTYTNLSADQINQNYAAHHFILAPGPGLHKDP